MSTNAVAKAILESDAPIYYSDTGETSTATTISGTEFWIEDELAEPADTALNHPEVAYAFRLADTVAIVNRDDVLQLEKYFRGNTLP